MASITLERARNHLAWLNWRRETLYLLTAAMEVAWFTPWYLALIPSTARLSPARTAVGLFVVMIIPAYAARLLLWLRLKPKIRAGVLAALLALTCLLAMRVVLFAGHGYEGLEWLGATLTDVLDLYQIIPDWFVIVMSTLFLWWRGSSLGQQRPSVHAVTLRFYLGIVSFIGFVLLVNLATREDPSLFIPVFFFYGLMALAATRMDEMRGLRGALRSPFGCYWLGSIGLAALIAVLLGVLLGAFFTGGSFKSVISWLQPLWLVVGVLLGLLLLALKGVADVLLGFLRSLGVENVTAPLTDLVEGLGDLLPDSSATTLPAAAGPGLLRLLLLGGLLVGLGALVIWLVGHASWEERRREGEDQETALSAALLLDSLRQWAERGRGRVAAVLGLLERSGVRGLFAALTIRRIYAQMLRLAADQGYPRAPFQTPYEYEDTAVRAFPGSLAEVHTITEAYVAAHYGEVPDSAARMQQIRACWERLRNSTRSTAQSAPQRRRSS